MLRDVGRCCCCWYRRDGKLRLRVLLDGNGAGDATLLLIADVMGDADAYEMGCWW